MKPRVLSVINQYWPFEGGAESLTRFVVEETNKLGAKNNVLTIGKKQIELMAGRSLPRIEQVESLYTIYRFRLPSVLGKERNGKLFRYMTLVKCMYHLLALRNKFDIIHAQTFYWTTTASILIGKLLRKPVIVTGHSTLTMLVDEIKSGNHPSFLLTILKYADKYVAINDTIPEEATSIAGISPKRVVVIPNGIDTKQYRPAADQSEKDALRLKCNLPQEAPLLIYHGRLEDYKNIQTLLRALDGVRKKGIPFNLLLLGDGPYKDSLEKLVVEYGLEHHVQFLGFKSNVEEYLRAADIYCLPSRIEGLSLALLEAMASGLVCIASAINGNKTVVKDGENGFLFEVDQYRILEEHILTLLSTLDKQASLSVQMNARKTVVDHFSLDTMTQQYLELYSQVWSEHQQQ